MKWYDVEDSAQADIMGSNTSNEISYKKEESIFSSSKGDNRKNAFKDFKV